MKARFTYIAAACALLVLSGCIDTNTKVTVKPDGSGTIERTIVLSKHFAELMASMGNKDDPAKIENNTLNEKGLKDEAARMGSGVAFVSAQKVSTDKGNGYKVLYTFKDIGKVKLNNQPGAGLTMSSSSGSTPSSAPTDTITFKFAPGPTATLTIIEPKPAQAAKPAAAAPPASGPDADKMMAQLKPLYSDMHIVLTVVVQGTITATNAAYANGSTVTLVDMDFAKILADDATFKKLSSSQNQSITEVQKMVKAVPGVIIDTQDSVKISFK
jgi:hypothetical protein